jgi:hypothetical protein
MVGWAGLLREVGIRVGFIKRRVDWEAEVADWSR